MRRKRRKKKNLRIILTALLVAAFVAALGAVLIWKVFVVKDVSVKGNEIIIRTSRLRTGFWMKNIPGIHCMFILKTN